MYKKKKEVQRSIRMTNDIDGYIQNFKGNGFNEKLENLVFFCIFDEEEIKRRIERKKEELSKLEKEVQAVYEMVESLTICVKQSKILENSLIKCNSKIKTLLSDR